MSTLGSTTINQGHHIGLQQLMAMATATHAFLGPNKRYKFIQDESRGDSSLVSSCFRLLENLDLSCCVGHLLNETTQAHQKVHRSGTGSLLFLAGVWSRAALECLHRGITVPQIMSAMSEGLDVCSEACRASAVPIEDLLCKAAAQKDKLREHQCGDPPHSDGSMLTGSLQHTGLRSPSQISSRLSLPNTTVAVPRQRAAHMAGIDKGKASMTPRVKLKHSRHFNSNANTEPDNPAQALYLHTRDSRGVEIVHLANAVSHGCMAAMSLVVEASRMQLRNSGKDDSCRTFDVTKLVTCVLPGMSEDHACVLPGYVVLLCVEQTSLVKHLKDQKLQIALVNGDLSDKYRHLGFNKPPDVRYVTDHLDLTGVSREDEWMDLVLTTLMRFGVNVLLVNGAATKKLTDSCVRHNILVIQGVKRDIMEDFAETTGAIPITYITQLNERCIGTGVSVDMWRECSSSNGRIEMMAVNIVADWTALVTVVVTSSVRGKLQSLEDQFWGCAYRLHHTLKDGKLLPGAGVTEMLCILHLQKHMTEYEDQTKGVRSDKPPKAARATKPFKSTVLQLMADGWMDYISTLMLNSGQFPSKADAWTVINQQLKDLSRGLCPGADVFGVSLNGASAFDLKQSETARVYDNVTVKLEAWRRALDLVFLVLQTDTEIITGLNGKEGEIQSNGFMFL